MKLPENGLRVLEKRYLMRDDKGKVIETAEGLFHRVADTIAQEDAKYGVKPTFVAKTATEFYQQMTEGKYLPNSPTLANAGGRTGGLSACLVLPVDDCITNGETGIYDIVKWQAVGHKAGIGTGFSFSKLRPRGAIVQGTKGQASGPVSFMEWIFNASTEAIKQGGLRMICFLVEV